MKAKFLTILFVAISMLFIACDEDSITEAVVGTNSVTVTGDIAKSFDAYTVAGLDTEDGSEFVLILSPTADLSDFDNTLMITKATQTFPEVGTHTNINHDEDDQDAFHALFYSSSDSTSYLMHSGTIKFTESSSSKVVGTFDMVGYPVSYTLIDSTRVLNITGEFSTIPLDFD